MRSGSDRHRWWVIAVVAMTLAAACGHAPEMAGSTTERAVPGASAARGRALIHAYGCGACHYVPGVPGARGRVAPNLTGFARQQYLAGGLVPNTAERLVAWIEDPHAVKPGTSMPAVGVSHAEAAHIAAYLYTLE
jgi:cytochrome c